MYTYCGCKMYVMFMYVHMYIQYYDYTMCMHSCTCFLLWYKGTFGPRACIQTIIIKWVMYITYNSNLCGQEHVKSIVIILKLYNLEI